MQSSLQEQDISYHTRREKMESNIAYCFSQLKIAFGTEYIDDEKVLKAMFDFATSNIAFKTLIVKIVQLFFPLCCNVRFSEDGKVLLFFEDNYLRSSTAEKIYSLIMPIYNESISHEK